jgi:hypothetical protein
MRTCLGKVTKGKAMFSRLHIAVLWIMLLFVGVPLVRPQASDVLPAPLYFVRYTDQIWRIERDATTLTQITQEDNPVTAFDTGSCPDDRVPGFYVVPTGSLVARQHTPAGAGAHAALPGHKL